MTVTPELSQVVDAILDRLYEIQQQLNAENDVSV